MLVQYSLAAAGLWQNGFPVLTRLSLVMIDGKLGLVINKELEPTRYRTFLITPAFRTTQVRFKMKSVIKS